MNLEVGDNVEILGVITFIRGKKAIRSSVALGECQAYLCEKRFNGFWRVRLPAMNGAEALVHQTAIHSVIPGVKTWELGIKPAKSQEPPVNSL